MFHSNMWMRYCLGALVMLRHIAIAVPPNDRCNGATDLGSFGEGQSLTVLNQSNIGATDDSADSPYCGVTPEIGVWYKISIASPAQLTVSTCNKNNFNTKIAVYSGSCGSLVCEAGIDNFSVCGWKTSPIDNVDSGDIYIRVEGYFGSTGNFDLTVSVSAIRSTPLNDRCEDAVRLWSFPDGQNVTILGQSNIGATDEITENVCGVNTQNGVWYALNVHYRAEVTVTTCDSANFDTQVVFYSGYCGNLTCLDYESTGCQKTGRFEEMGYKQIYIRIGGYEGATGNFNLTVRVSAIVPENDRCEDALDLGSIAQGQSISVLGSTNGATPAVWYKSRVEFPAEVIASTCGQVYFSAKQIELYTGSCGSLLHRMGYEAPNYCSQTIYADDIDADYIYVRVQDYEGNIEDFNLTLSVLAVYPPLNDQCNNAEDIGYLTEAQGFEIEGSTNGALNDSDDSPWCGVEAQRGVWYKLSIGFAAEVTVSVYSWLDFQVAFYSGTCGSLICHTDVDDFLCGCENTIRFYDKDIPDNVYIRVVGVDGITSRFSMSVSVSPNYAPPNDQCDGALDLGSFTDGQSHTITNQTNIGATDGMAEVLCEPYTQYGVWYKLSVAFRAEVTVSVCDGATFDARVALHHYQCGGLFCDKYPSSSCQTTERFEAQGYQEIYILVGGHEGTTGNFNLTVSVSLIPPENDRCDDARDLGTVDHRGMLAYGTTIGATSDNVESLCGVESQHGVWYKFRVAFPAVITVSTCDQAIQEPTQIVLYSGACGSLMCQTGNEGPGLCSQTIHSDDIATNYLYFRVEDCGGYIGDFILNLRAKPIYPPLNDQCKGAKDLGFFIDGQSLQVEGSTIGALNDSAESPSCSVETQRGVWYKLTIAFPAEVTVYACHEYQNFQIAVYSGTCGSLVCQADVDDINGCSSKIRFLGKIIPTDVYIRVEGVNGTTGNFSMDISVSAISPVIPSQTACRSQEMCQELFADAICLYRPSQMGSYCAASDACVHGTYHAATRKCVCDGSGSNTKVGFCIHVDTGACTLPKEIASIDAAGTTTYRCPAQALHHGGRRRKLDAIEL